jgi:rhamnulose-1-phosphate aldolase
MDKKKFSSLEPIVNEIAATAGYLWDRGWAERNAGNLSVNVTELLTPAGFEVFENSIIRPLPLNCHYLAGQVLMVTTSGSRMRDISKNPWDYLCLMKVDPGGDHFRQWPDKGCAATSEIPTHLAVQNKFLQTNSTSRVLLHAHVTELIALTQIRELCSSDTLNHLLWSMHPDCHLFIPDGVAFIPYDLPGTSDIALASINALKDCSIALWEKHGVLSSGLTVTEAFDNLDLIAKASRIYFLVKSARYEPEGLTSKQLDELAG